MDGEAASVPSGSNGLIVLPSFLGERWPAPDPMSRGAVFGLTLSHTKAHVYRALLESYAHDVRQGVHLLTDLGIPVQRLTAVGGGARRGLCRLIVSDVTGLPQCYASKAGDHWATHSWLGMVLDTCGMCRRSWHGWQISP